MTTKLSRVHYAWIVMGVTFAVMLVSAGVRSAPGVLILPLEAEFGWDRASVSLAIAVGILVFGLGGPLSGSLIDRFGPRWVMLGGAALVGLGLLPMLIMRELWQLHLLWGVVVGLGTGVTASVLSTTVAYRWFHAHRGLVMGLFATTTSAGQMVFVPAMMALAVAAGWRSAVWLMLAASLGLLVPVLLLMRNRPADVGLAPLGLSPAEQHAATRGEDERRTSLREALRSHDFWLLAGTFFVCGYTSNGLVQTHLIPHAVEHGFTEVAAASTLALMGTMNIFGSLGSGWLTDRFDNRKLLAMYYGLRALAIAGLPFILDVPWLMVFAVVYGLDWIATVPPTANLTASIFGKASLGTLFGWIFFSHMLGAAIAAYIGGVFREWLGDYHLVFLSAAVVGFMAVALSMWITPQRRLAPQPA
jgi:MFS family permease